MVDRCEIELHMNQLDAEPGEVPLNVLAEIARHMADLALRIARQLDDAPGPERTRKPVEESAQLSLAGLSPGSTNLMFAGPVQVQQPLSPEMDPTAELFAAIEDTFAELGNDRVPHLSGPARESLASFLRVFGETGARQIELAVTTRIPGRGSKTTNVQANNAFRQLMREVVAVSSSLVGADVEVSGRLYRVDIRSGAFRIEDDIGTSVNFEVAEALRSRAAHFVGSRVSVSGQPEYDAQGRISRIHDATVALAPAFASSAGWSDPDPADYLDTAQPFDRGDAGIEGLSDDEIEAFLDALSS